METCTIDNGDSREAVTCDQLKDVKESLVTDENIQVLMNYDSTADENFKTDISKSNSEYIQANTCKTQNICNKSKLTLL